VRLLVEIQGDLNGKGHSFNELNASSLKRQGHLTAGPFSAFQIALFITSLSMPASGSSLTCRQCGSMTWNCLNCDLFNIHSNSVDFCFFQTSSCSSLSSQSLAVSALLFKLTLFSGTTVVV
jgi:hypothetical protein